MNNTFKSLLAGLVLSCAQLTAHSAVLVSYALPGPSSDPASPTATNSADATGSFGVGSDLNPTGNTFISGYLVTPSTHPATLSDAVTDNSYYSFTITPTTGDEITLSSFDLSNTTLYSLNDDTTFALESNVTHFGSGSGNVLASYSSTTTGSDVLPLGLGFADQTEAIEFRLYAYGGSSYYLSLQNGPITVNGVATATVNLPEPSVVTLLLLGAGGLFLIARRKGLLA